jgi:RNA polymerase sigma factor (sigma-70 family)
MQRLEEPAAPVAAENGSIGDLNLLLGLLRPVEREALYLHHVEGYTAQEIAELTGTPRNTILSLLNRGLRKLQTAGLHA